MAQWKIRTCLFCIVNTLNADVLVVQSARTSAALVNLNIPLSAPEKLNPIKIMKFCLENAIVLASPDHYTNISMLYLNLFLSRQLILGDWQWITFGNSADCKAENQGPFLLKGIN